MPSFLLFAFCDFVIFIEKARVTSILRYHYFFGKKKAYTQNMNSIPVWEEILEFFFQTGSRTKTSDELVSENSL